MAPIKHGGCKTPEYFVWAAMIARCFNEDHVKYPDYGGRGIKVCIPWIRFENFIADMGLRPSPRHTLDRWPNNDGNYEPGNVRWATQKEQSRNKRTNVRFEVGGENLTLSEWSERTGISSQTIGRRMRQGMTPKEIFSHANLRYLPIKNGTSGPSPKQTTRA